MKQFLMKDKFGSFASLVINLIFIPIWSVLFLKFILPINLNLWWNYLSELTYRQTETDFFQDLYFLSNLILLLIPMFFVSKFIWTGRITFKPRRTMRIED